MEKINAEKENLRVVISKRMLKEGLLRCLERERVDKLSISELCREAGVNRATFYNHYQTPQEILNDIGWDHAREIRRIFASGARDTDASVRERMTKCFAYLYENKPGLKILFSANADTYIAEAAKEIFMWSWEQELNLRKHIELDDREYQLAVTSYGWAAYHLIREWLVEDVDLMPEQITELFIKLAGKNIFG